MSYMHACNFQNPKMLFSKIFIFKIKERKKKTLKIEKLAIFLT